MNSWLAQIYGTGGASNDIEKTAQSMLLEKMAAAEGIDISGLTPEQVSALAAEVIPLEGEETQQTQQVQQNQGQQVQPQQQQGMIAQAGGEAPSEETVDEDITKEAHAKFEEADFLGRVMAHSYTQELEKIAEQRKTAGFGDAARRFGGAAVDAAKHHGGAALSKGKEMGSQGLEFGKKHKGAIGAAAGAGAAGFGAGRMSKEASVFIEKLAEIRATEILAENGIDASTGKPFVQQQAQAPVAQQNQQGQQMQSAVAQPQQEVQQAVDERAVDMLQKLGYTFRS